MLASGGWLFPGLLETRMLAGGQNLYVQKLFYFEDKFSTQYEKLLFRGLTGSNSPKYHFLGANVIV